jgi:hypothetical protein
MIIAKSRKLIQKLFVLGLLLTYLGLLSANVGTKASCDANNNLLPCCSYCDEHPDAPICQHGCLFGCVK